MRHSPLSVILLPGITIAIAAHAPGAAVYSTGFEAPEFAPGQIAGQAGWTTTASAFSSQAATVSPAAARTGAQGLAIDATFIPQTDWFFKPLNFMPGPGTRVVKVGVDMRVNGTALNSAGWGVDCYDTLGVRIGQFFVAPNGLASISGGGDSQAAALTNRSAWTTFVLTLDFSTRLLSLSVNGQSAAVSVAFNPTSLSTLGDADIRVLGAGTDTAFFDNFSVEAVPAPACGGAVVLLAGAGRRRRPQGE